MESKKSIYQDSISDRARVLLIGSDFSENKDVGPAIAKRSV